MSKMTMPTVDVVRFQESDVIVASGVKPEGPAMYIYGFVSEGPKDGSIAWDGETYFGYNDYSGLISSLKDGGYGTTVLGNPDGWTNSINRMFELNQSADTFNQVATTTGNYYWNSSTNRWEYYYM